MTKFDTAKLGRMVSPLSSSSSSSSSSFPLPHRDDDEEERIKRAVALRIQELRVARSELVSGNTFGEVLRRPSAGAAFFPLDRSEAIRSIEGDIRALGATL